MKPIVLLLAVSVFLFSCVSSKKYKQSQGSLTAVQGDLTNCNTDKANLTKERDDLKAKNASLDSRISDLNRQVDILKENNTAMLKQLQDLRYLRFAGRKYKKIFGQYWFEDAYIQDLQASLARKDSLNMALVMNLKGSHRQFRRPGH